MKGLGRTVVVRGVWLVLVLLAAGSAAHAEAPAGRGDAASRPAGAGADRRLRGRVPATVRRPLAPCDDKALARMLQRFEVKPDPFDWRMTSLVAAGRPEIYAVAFPSPIRSPVTANNTVHCEYYPVAGRQRRAAVIVLHILDGRFRLARGICHTLRRAGVHALLVKLPYYGPRRPKDKAVLTALAKDPDNVIAAVVQAVADIRRAARWLAARDETRAERIGLCGVSLGGFAAALAGGVDGRFGRVVIVLAGGRLERVLTSGAWDLRAVKAEIDRRHWSQARLRKILEPVEPMTYASRLRSSRVLIIAGRRDAVVPPICAESLAEACGAKITWYPAGHYSMALYLPPVLIQLVGHFQAGVPTTQRDR